MTQVILVKVFISAMLTVVLSACVTQVRPPESEPTTYKEPPQIVDRGYAVYEAKRVFKAPLVALRKWIEKDSKIVAAMEETDRIKKPVDTKVVSGTWPEVGSVRWIKFSDGHYVFERVLVNDFPTLFRYQVWDHSSSVAKNISYAVGQQSWQVLRSGEAELTWTYKLQPKGFIRKPFVQNFVNQNMRPLMDSALDKIVEQSEKAFSRPPDINSNLQSNFESGAIL